MTVDYAINNKNEGTRKGHHTEFHVVHIHRNMKSLTYFVCQTRMTLYIYGLGFFQRKETFDK